MQKPKKVELIGGTLAILWSDGAEDYFESEFLRVNSPSAQNMGETDIFGTQYGGDGPRAFPGVQVREYQFVGNYALKLFFSDGHSTGIFSWEYLKELSAKKESR